MNVYTSIYIYIHRIKHVSGRVDISMINAVRDETTNEIDLKTTGIIYNIQYSKSCDLSLPADGAFLVNRRSYTNNYNR